jgi:hypothetical protein
VVRCGAWRGVVRCGVGPVKLTQLCRPLSLCAPHARTHTHTHAHREIPADDPEAELPLHGPNQWPAEELLPGFRATMTAYFEALSSLSHKLLRLVALSLQLPGVRTGVADGDGR